MGAAAQRPECTWKGGCGTATGVHMEGGLQRSDLSSHGRGKWQKLDVVVENSRAMLLQCTQ